MYLEPLYLEALKVEEIDKALKLADECVGKNLYSMEDFLSAINNKDKFFFLLKNKQKEIAGYIYFLITSSAEVEKTVNISLSSIPYSEKCGRIQSVAVKEESRGLGFSSYMINYALEVLDQKNIDTVYIVCWKPGGVLPLKKALGKCNFEYLITVKDAWYKDEDLICPYCKGRCHCSADIYYKKLQNDEENEI